MTRPLLAAGIALLCAGPAVGQMMSPDMADALMGCSAHVSKIGPSNPPVVLEYEGEWDAPCKALNAKMAPQLESDRRQYREEDRRRLETVKKLAGEK